MSKVRTPRDYEHFIRLGSVFEADGSKWIVEGMAAAIDGGTVVVDCECQEVSFLGLQGRAYYGFVFVVEAIKQFNIKYPNNPANKP